MKVAITFYGETDPRFTCEIDGVARDLRKRRGKAGLLDRIELRDLRNRLCALARKDHIRRSANLHLDDGPSDHVASTRTVASSRLRAKSRNNRPAITPGVCMLRPG